MGGQKGIAFFCSYLGMHNELTAVSVEDNKTELAETYEMIPLFTKKRARYLNFFSILRIKKIVKQKNIQNVITEHPYMGWMGWMLKKDLKVKWFVHSHNIEFERFRTLNKPWYRLLKIYEKWCYKNADAVFFKTNEDINFAVNNKMVKNENAILVPFGIEIKEMPDDKPFQKKKICNQFKIPENTTLILFNGALDYKPNTDALLFILEKLNPALLNNKLLDYRIIICGRGLPLFLKNLESYADKNIIYAGFVDDVVTYFKAADIFLNPVVSGGGVKTKVVEAIGYGATVISCKTGAAGIEAGGCGDKLKIVPDNDVSSFISSIYESIKKKEPTPLAYYKYYHWDNIINNLQKLFIS